MGALTSQMSHDCHVFIDYQYSSTQYNPRYDVVVSADEKGMVEYWGGPDRSYQFPTNVSFQYKTETDLYEFVKCSTWPCSLSFSPDGELFVTMSTDRKVCVHVLTHACTFAHVCMFKVNICHVCGSRLATCSVYPTCQHPCAHVHGDALSGVHRSFAYSIRAGEGVQV